MPLFGVAFYLAAAWVTWRTTDPTRMFGLQPRAVLAALGAIGIAVSIFLTGVEFADFQCPPCAATAPELQQLVDNGSITLVYRYFPLPQHPLAQLAATAAAAADVQGKFWPLHDKLFETQSSWENLSAASATTYITQLASQVGLDVTRCRAD